jgi:hypothetical protein
MSILIVPYEGESPELTKALTRHNMPQPKKLCKKGSCPIPKLCRLMNADEIKTSITNSINSIDNIKNITILALNKNDMQSLINMNHDRKWSDNQNINIKIVCA